MELPDLGAHCARPDCARLDFLPVKCGGCKKVFCGQHFPYESHGCSKDVQVPVCPLCDRPIPVRRKGDPPDLLVSQHIDSDCQSDPAKDRRKVFDQRCAVRKCKKKEMVQIRCEECRNNYCLQHRHPKDHQCKGTDTRSKALEAAVKRQIAEDEALAKALQSSVTSSPAGNGAPKMSQEELDHMMALTLATDYTSASSSRQQSSEQNKSCLLS